MNKKSDQQMLRFSLSDKRQLWIKKKKGKENLTNTGTTASLSGCTSQIPSNWPSTAKQHSLSISSCNGKIHQCNSIVLNKPTRVTSLELQRAA